MIETDLTANAARIKLEPFFEHRPFVIAEINRYNTDGQVYSSTAWEWLYQQPIPYRPG
jgi:hypothetical protein